MTEATKGQAAPQAGSGNQASANAALARAREFDQQGREADCMNAIGEAKRATAR
jgi:hypothetical protein